MLLRTREVLKGSKSMLKEYIDAINAEGQTVFFIRHAERYPIDDMKDALQIRLTGKGHIDSMNLGKELAPHGPFSLFHSPVPRCMETAQMINDGITSSGIESKLSGELLELGGPYVKGDWVELVKRTREAGPSAFVRQWFDTDQHDDLMVPLETAAETSLAFLQDQLETLSTSVINVSHDWNIMILREYFFQIRHEDYGMPDFLDGLALFNDSGKTVLSYHDRQMVL